jgi:DNA-binding transcriptional MerR regulator
MASEKSPDAFRTISEVADWLEVPAHVLRFWESRFTQVKPVKRAGGRRYYRPADMALLDGIRKLLHDDGMTIRGVQKLLREDGVKEVAALSRPLLGAAEAAGPVATPVALAAAAGAAPAPPGEAAAAPMAEDVAPDDDPASTVVPFQRSASHPAAAPGAPAPAAAPLSEPAPPESEPESDAVPAPAPRTPAPRLPPDTADDDPGFAEPPRRYAALARVPPERLRALHDRLAAIRRRLGDPGRRPPLG